MSIIVPEHDDGIIRRIEMPQVDEKEYVPLMVFLGERGIRFSAGRIDPRRCRSHQPIDEDRAMKIPEEVLGKAILVSSGNFIIDGNHRWYRHYIERSFAPFVRIERDFFDALSCILDFPRTYREGE
jgi:hypothetical protein